MPPRASSYEFTDKIIHKVKTEGLRGLSLLVEDDFNSYSVGTIASVTSNKWIGHTGNTTDVFSFLDTTDMVINASRMGGDNITAGTINRYGVFGSNVNWDSSRDYIVEGRIGLSGITGEDPGIMVEGPQTGNPGPMYAFTWGNLTGNPAVDVLFSIRGMAFQVANVPYLTAGSIEAFVARIEYTSADNNWRVFVNDTLRHTVARPLQLGNNFGMYLQYIPLAFPVAADSSLDNFSLRGFRI